MGLSTDTDSGTRWPFSTGSVAPGQMGGHRPRTICGQHEAWLAGKKIVMLEPRRVAVRNRTGQPGEQQFVRCQRRAAGRGEGESFRPSGGQARFKNLPQQGLVVGVGDSITAASHNTAGAGITYNSSCQPRIQNTSGSVGGFHTWATILLGDGRALAGADGVL